MLALLIAWAQSSAATARLEVEKATFELGEPIELTLAVEHALDCTVKFAATAPGLDESWTVLEHDEPRTTPDAQHAGRAQTVEHFRVASLEPGAREIPAQRVELIQTEGGASSLSIFTQPASVEIRGVLGEKEDVARPIKGFHTRLEVGERAPQWPWIVGLAVCAALGAGLWLGRRLRARQTPAAIRVTPLVELDTLSATDLERAENVREAHFELTRILRSAIDEKSGVVRSGLDDREWLTRALEDAGLGARLAPSKAELTKLLEDCARIKYGGESATHWAARRRVAQARKILEALELAEAQP